MRTLGLPIVLMFSGLMALAGGCQSSGAHLHQGFLALDEQRYDDAQAAADQYLRDHPAGGDLAGAYYLKGQAIERRPKSSETEANTSLQFAEQHYLKALQFPADRSLQGYIQTAMGNCCYWQSDYAAALRYWRQALDLLEDSGYRMLVLYRTGVCRQRLGQWTEADAIFASVQQQAAGTEVAQRAREHQGARAFYVQVAAFRDAASAEKLIATLRAGGVACGRYEKADSKLQLVMAGPAQTYNEAMTVRNRLLPQYKDAFVTLNR